MTDSKRTYLDYNASAPLLACAHDAMLSVVGTPVNASSVHYEGREARKRVESARRQVAEMINANPANVIFTSGATEGAVHALSPNVRAGGRRLYASKLYVCATDHKCMLSGGRFEADNIVEIPVESSGFCDLLALKQLLSQHDASTGLPMVAVQYANNETGVIHPLPEIADIVHQHDGIFVVDAVQALGKLSFDQADTGADFLIFSSHKIGGPQGAGALVLSNGSMSPAPLLTGGGQENYHRAGTENVAAIAGFGAACMWHQENLSKTIQKKTLRDSIENGIVTISEKQGNTLGHPSFFGNSVERLGNTSCFAVPGIKAETALMALDLDGISVSSGSACSSGKVSQSHVLRAMGATQEEMSGAIRVSLGWNTTKEEVEIFLDAWTKFTGRQSQIGRA